MITFTATLSETTTKSHCNQCGPERDHEILRHHPTKWDDEENSGTFGGTDYDLLRCCGCSKISLRETGWNSEWLDDDGRPESSYRYYPPAIFRNVPRWLPELRQSVENGYVIEELLTEIYVGLQNDLHRVSAMGIRALLEHVMIDRVGDNGSFKKNVDAFVAAGIIAPAQREFLEAVLEAGHATMHRSYSPSKDDLIALMDITESIIESAYLHRARVDRLRSRIPPRTP